MLYLCLSKDHSSPSSIVYFTEDTTLQTFFATIDPTKQYTYVSTYKVLNQCPHHLTLKQLHIGNNDTIIVRKENTTPFVLPPQAVRVRLQTEGATDYQSAMLFKNTTVQEFFYVFDYNENYKYYLDEMWHLNDVTYQDFTFEQLGVKEDSAIVIAQKDDAPWFSEETEYTQQKDDISEDGWGDLKLPKKTTIAWSWGYGDLPTKKSKKRRHTGEGANAKRTKTGQTIFSV